MKRDGNFRSFFELDDWLLYTAIVACVLIAGILLGLAISGGVSLVLAFANLLTAFGTVLLGIAALRGINEWRGQEALKALQRKSEQALPRLRIALDSAEELEWYIEGYFKSIESTTFTNDSLSQKYLNESRRFATDVHCNLRSAESHLLYFPSQVLDKLETSADNALQVSRTFTDADILQHDLCADTLLPKVQELKNELTSLCEQVTKLAKLENIDP